MKIMYRTYIKWFETAHFSQDKIKEISVALSSNSRIPQSIKIVQKSLLKCWQVHMFRHYINPLFSILVTNPIKDSYYRNQHILLFQIYSCKYIHRHYFLFFPNNLEGRYLLRLDFWLLFFILCDCLVLDLGLVLGLGLDLGLAAGLAVATMLARLAVLFVTILADFGSGEKVSILWIVEVSN